MKYELIVLMLTFVMPPDQPDLNKNMKEPSIEKCWDDAKAFVEQGISNKQREDGVIALRAGCLVREAAHKDM